MNDSLGNPGKEKRKKNKRLIVPLSLIAIILLALIIAVSFQLSEKQNEAMQQGNNVQNGNADDSYDSVKDATDSFFDFLKKEPEEVEWVIEGEPVSDDLLYGYYLPEHCSDTTIANVDVVMNMFEEKEWSTYISSNGKKITLSAVPLLWNGSQITLDLISQKRLESLEHMDDPYVTAELQAYDKVIRELYATQSLTKVTYYNERGNMYTIDCTYTVDGNELILSMIHYDKEKQEYSVIPMETYQVIRENNEITIYKDKNFVKYVPYNLCENSSIFRIEAFAKNRKDMYDGIAGFAYYNLEPEAERWPLYGCVYFSDGSKAPNAIFDFSEDNQIRVRWYNREVEYFGSIVTVSDFREITFSYEMVQDTGLIFEIDGEKYYYLEQFEE